MRQHLVLGTAGHIDHGKSSLVRALTGSDPDRLPEEKARGVTIELGFAHLSLEDENTEYEIGIVDVPGHADFVNNMVAGVGALDLALFIIAADDGWMPQSEEHLHILSYLGISNIIIALTKSDLCEDIDFTIEVLRDELKNTGISDVPIIPVSSITGDGIENLKKSIATTLRSCPVQVDAGKPRLAIDRIFSPQGAGTVVTGTLSGGSVNIGDSLVLQPDGLTTRVRYIQNHSQSLETALPGMRTALNLPDLPISAPGKKGAERGHTLTSEGCGKPTVTVDIKLERMTRAIPGIKPRPLRHMETVILHHGSTRCRARVILQDRSHLNPGENCHAQLRLEDEQFFLLGDRVVLRDGAQQNTLAGGTVLDTRPTRYGFRTETRADFLKTLSENPLDIRTHLEARLKRDHSLSSHTPLHDSPFSEDNIEKAVQSLADDKKLITLETDYVYSPWWQEQISTAKSAVTDWHKRHPDLPGIPLDQLASSLEECSERLFGELIITLESDGFQRKGKTLAASNHSLSLPAEIKTQAESIIAKLDQAGLQPPSPAELTTTDQHAQALQFLLRSGQVIELDAKVVISAESRDAAIEKIRGYLEENGQATASELRQHLDSTRKVVMPLLEHLDDLGITVRNDNHRTLV
ncbi:MAG: selenocysteine-specific translation elongation factor [Akkermansiaceae bacterium]